MFRKPASLLLFAFCILILSCRPSPQYQDHFNVPKNSWTHSFKPVFNFTVDDTAAGYQLFFLVRHTDVYPFSNIWLLMETKGPGDTAFNKMRVEVPLAAQTGQWLGRGTGDIWEQRVAINTAANPAMFPHKGEYSVRLSHDMRKDPLPEVMQVGLRIEKIGVPAHH